MAIDETIAALAQKFPGAFSEPVRFQGETTLTLKDPSQLVAAAKFLKHDRHFEMLVDVCAVDQRDEPRFELVYHLYSFKTREILRLKVRVAENPGVIASLTQVWHAADWHEREAYDMLGVRFDGHPDLRRILMWEGYPYFPIRKDFPLAGRQTEDTRPVPMDGGPFVSRPGQPTAIEREPRAKGETDRLARPD